MKWSEENRVAFGKIVREAREEMSLTQAAVAEQVTSITGISCDQKKICNIELGNVKKVMDKKTLEALCDVLSISEENCLLACDKETAAPRNWLSIHGQPHLLTYANDYEFKSFLGKYFCVFRSTETTKDELIHCDMDIARADDGSCDVTLVLHINNSNKTKRYAGKFFINNYYDMCYILLCGNVWQEICIMIAPRFKASSNDNKFFTPLVLTTSAGTKKRPTVHRMIISRKRLRGEALELAKSQLLLNNDSIEITLKELGALENRVASMLKTHPDDKLYLMVEKFCHIIRKYGTQEMIFRIEESDLLDISRNGGDKKTRSMATAMVRNYSKGVYHNKISDAGPGILNEILDSIDAII